MLTGCLSGDSGPAQIGPDQNPSPTIFISVPTQTTSKEATATTISQPADEVNPTATPTPKTINPTSTEPSEGIQDVTEPSPTPTSQSGESTSDTPPADRGEKDCTDIAAYYGDVNIPDKTRFFALLK